MNGLKDILDQLRKRYPKFGKRLREAQAFSRWPEIVGPQIARHSRVLGVKEGILRVAVDHPAWCAELYYQRQSILNKLRESLSQFETESERSLWDVKEIQFLSDSSFPKRFESKGRAKPRRE